MSEEQSPVLVHNRIEKNHRATVILLALVPLLPLCPIGTIFGMEDIQNADPDFDERFVIQGNYPTKLRWFLGDPSLKALIHGGTSVPWLAIT